MKDYAYEGDAQYCYPGTHVLINKLNITDHGRLETAERELTALRIAKAKDVPVKGKLDFRHLRDIHRYIFSDIYPWAGTSRNVNISKGNQFCLCMHIEQYAADLFGRLEKEAFLITAPRDTVPRRLAFYLSEINVLHPFREGNGRAQRVFIEYLAAVAGFEVDFSRVGAEEMISASADSYACDYTRINAMFERIASPVGREAQRTAISLIAGERSRHMRIYLRYS